jgi:hypothetical protein
MLSMTDYPTPKFPATPEEVKAASEKVVNFWVGALSPMWVPFWAASGFGLSAWAMTQSLSKNEGLLKDMPQMADMAGKWPGFSVWAAGRPDVAAETVDTVEKAAGTVVEAADAAPEAEVAFDPVIEAPVAISDAAVEAPAVLKAKAPKVEPKPIARAGSAARKPTKKA